MSYKKLIISILCLLLFPVFVFGQIKKEEKLDMAQALTKPTKLQTIVSLIGLDPNRFTMSHSYSLSFTSFGGRSFSQGLYLNTMKYQLSNPITMYLQIGFLNQPFGGYGQKSPFNNKLFLSGAGFEFKPSDSFKLQFEYSQTPSTIYSPYYHNRFYHNRSWREKEEDEN
ncbi:MAG: hypothetical protein ACE5JB_08915 [bacterium]